ncbi:NAD(P)H-dependent oxidoreductase [Rubrivivax gelatinosus]|uniref:Glutathione-regulated potassium-efflux system ancillary protein KefF n=1 Tax=Rubrivivax gelatinosus TaxID=28068 RepID=A0A4R2MLZ2_RUBGE|nr:NAD(P)H-dependent oxidoreductase [Rubrivivax gelatinosus]MBK1685930.1 NAD(P)H dehydrogenase [Rubrivivax gelatinosus]TCP04046.1 glutathione-regulated potassium-efflux system ancillary protein KefF [Rubrivivax gelatinosus]
MKTLVIVSHPGFEQSAVTRTIKQVAESLPDTEVRHLEERYGDDAARFDVTAEQAAHDAVERIVIVFPIHWFNLTPMLKAYMNRVWTYGWAFGPGGTALRGKRMQVVVSAGAAEATYSHQGLIRSTMDEVLTPLKASALYIGMRWEPPLAFYGVMNADAARLAGIGQAFAQRMADCLEPA